MESVRGRMLGGLQCPAGMNLCIDVHIDVYTRACAYALRLTRLHRFTRLQNVLKKSTRFQPVSQKASSHHIKILEKSR